MSKPTLLIPIQWYSPGFRAGGLIQATQRLAEALAMHYQVYILTTNNDLGSNNKYPNIESDCWLTTNTGVSIKYLSERHRTLKQIRAELTALQPDLIYLKSMFNPLFSIYILWLKYTRAINGQLIVAPSGMLKESALAYRPWKKKAFLSVLLTTNLCREMRWHATDLQEQDDIKKQIGEQAAVWMLPEFSPDLDKVMEVIPKKNALSLLYLSRIHPVKNLSFLIETLKEVKEIVSLNIFGPIADESYWKKCQELFQQLPANITTSYSGELPHPEVAKTMRQHHVFVLPTQGEGFGNVILEALCCARPVLISDQTPWHNLQAHKAGWDLPLDQPQAFVKAIEQLAAMDQATYNSYCQGALDYAKKSTDNKKLVEEYRKMFSLTQPPSPKP